MTYLVEGPQYDRREGYGVYDDDRRDYDQPARVLSGKTKEQAEYAAMVLNAGGIDTDGLDFTDIEDILESEFILVVECTRCGAEHFAGESFPDGRCPGCQS